MKFPTKEERKKLNEERGGGELAGLFNYEAPYERGWQPAIVIDNADGSSANGTTWHSVFVGLPKTGTRVEVRIWESGSITDQFLDTIGEADGGEIADHSLEGRQFEVMVQKDMKSQNEYGRDRAKVTSIRAPAGGVVWAEGYPKKRAAAPAGQADDDGVPF